MPRCARRPRATRSRAAQDRAGDQPVAPLGKKIISAIISGVVPDRIDALPEEITAEQGQPGKLVDVGDVVNIKKSKMMPTAPLSASVTTSRASRKIDRTRPLIVPNQRAKKRRDEAARVPGEVGGE